MTMYQRYERILRTAARILTDRDPQPNRTAAYNFARERAHVIAKRAVYGR